jgi:hypothetical protein
MNEMLPDVRFAIGAGLAIALLGVTALGMFASVQVAHRSRIGPLEASLNTPQSTDPPQWNQFPKPEDVRRFDSTVRQAEGPREAIYSTPTPSGAEVGVQSRTTTVAATDHARLTDSTGSIATAHAMSVDFAAETPAVPTASPAGEVSPSAAASTPRATVADRIAMPAASSLPSADPLSPAAAVPTATPRITAAPPLGEVAAVTSVQVETPGVGATSREATALPTARSDVERVGGPAAVPAMPQTESRVATTSPDATSADSKPAYASKPVAAPKRVKVRKPAKVRQRVYVRKPPPKARRIVRSRRATTIRAARRQSAPLPPPIRGILPPLPTTGPISELLGRR